MNSSRDNNVVLVFEPASDAHWMKDVVQFPNALAEELFKKKAILLTRPNNYQQEIAQHIDLVFLGGMVRENETVFATSNFSAIVTDRQWYSEACKIAAKLGNILILYPWYGNPFKGAFSFKLRRWFKNKRGTVILKTDGLLQDRAAHHTTLKQRWKDLRQFYLIDKIIIENRRVYTDLRRYSPQFTSKLAYIPNCPVDIYSNEKLVRYSDRHNKILFVGRVDDWEKGADILLEAWINIASQITTWRLEIAGPCSKTFKEHWSNKLKVMNIEKSIHWVGPKDPVELITHYSSSKIVVCSSRKESGPIILSEAALSGCAFIGTMVGEIPEVLDGLPGLIQGSVTLEDQILYFIKHSEVAEAQSKMLLHRMKDRKWSLQIKKAFLTGQPTRKS